MAELLYEGKAKQVYKTEKEDEYLIHYKDDATAGNGVKHDKFEGKGVLNNTISCIIFDMLEEAGIKTHMIKKLNERDILVKKVDIFPLEVIIRNITTGSFCRRLGAPEGIVLDEPIFEMSYKNDEYGDPLINDDHAVALKLATREELAYIKETTLKINELLKELTNEEMIYCLSLLYQLGVEETDIDNFILRYQSTRSAQRSKNAITDFLSQWEKINYHQDNEKVQVIKNNLLEYMSDIFVVDNEEYSWVKEEIEEEMNKFYHLLKGNYDYEKSIAKKRIKK